MLHELSPCNIVHAQELEQTPTQAPLPTPTQIPAEESKPQTTQPQNSVEPTNAEAIKPETLETKPVETPATVNPNVPEIKSIEADGVRTVIDSQIQKQFPYNTKTVSSSDYEAYLTTLNLGNLSIAENFVIYGDLSQKEAYYIPLASFLGSMHVQVEQKGDRIVGWFLKESNVIDIDIKTGFAKIGDQTYQFTANDAIMLYTDLLVSMPMLQKMFPVEYDFDLAQQILNVKTTTPFPIEQEISRASMLGKLGKGQGGEDAEELRKAKIEVQDYQMFSMPNVDVTYSTILNVKTMKTQQNLSFSSTSHLLKSELNVTGGATLAGIGSMKLALRKNDTVEHPFEHYLRPKQYWIGDIAAPSTNLVGTSSSGVGFSVSNIPPGWKIDFNNLQITGYSIPNWSVEIYLNNSLLNFSSVDATGLYAFQDIPLNVGLNTVKLIFYGPYGQTRETTQNINLSSSLLQKGKFVYDFTVLKEKLSLIQTPSSKLQSMGATAGMERYFGSVRYGLTGDTSLLLSTTSYMKKFGGTYDAQPERQHYLATSLMTDVFGVIVNTDLAYHINSNSAAVKLSTNATIFKESNLMVTSQFFMKNYLSESHMQSGANAQQSSTEIRLKNNIKLLGKFVASQYTATIGTMNSGDYTSSINAQHSFSPIKPISLVNSLSGNFGSGMPKSTSGNASATVKLGKAANIRGSLAYVPLFAKNFLTTSSLSANYNWRIFGVTTAYNLSFVNKIGTYMIGFNINSKYLTTSLQFGTQASMAMNLNWNFNRSIVFNAMKPSIMPTGAASGGIIELNAFIDTNNNNKWDFDELPAKNVAAKIAGKNSKELTGENGKVLIPNLPRDSAFLFDADTSVMEDMAVKPAGSIKRKIILKAGAIHKVFVPIVKISDIEGTLTIKMGEEVLPIGGAKVHVIDRSGAVVDTATTSADGYYMFNGLPQGAYKVVADKAIVAKYKNYLLTK